MSMFLFPVLFLNRSLNNMKHGKCKFLIRDQRIVSEAKRFEVVVSQAHFPQVNNFVYTRAKNYIIMYFYCCCGRTDSCPRKVRAVPGMLREGRY